MVIVQALDFHDPGLDRALQRRRRAVVSMNVEVTNAHHFARILMTREVFSRESLRALIVNELSHVEKAVGLGALC